MEPLMDLHCPHCGKRLIRICLIVKPARDEFAKSIELPGRVREKLGEAGTYIAACPECGAVYFVAWYDTLSYVKLGNMPQKLKEILVAGLVVDKLTS